MVTPNQDSASDSPLGCPEPQLDAYFWPESEMTIAEIGRVLRPGGRVLLAFRGSEHELPRRLDPAVYRDVTTNQCVDWLTGAGFVETLSHHPNGPPAEVSLVLAFWPSTAA